VGQFQKGRGSERVGQGFVQPGSWMWVEEAHTSLGRLQGLDKEACQRKIGKERRLQIPQERKSGRLPQAWKTMGT
jgi:hypothetical protein